MKGRMTEAEVIDFCQKTLDVYGVKARVVMNSDFEGRATFDNAEAGRAESRAVRRCELIDKLRNANELSGVNLTSSNPDFNNGPNEVIFYVADCTVADDGERFEGETIDECLEKAYAWLQEQKALPRTG